MFTGSYVLTLYCDTPGCPKSYERRPFGSVDTFVTTPAPPPLRIDSHERGENARAEARAKGWWLNREAGQCLCPECTRASNRTPNSRR